MSLAIRLAISYVFAKVWWGKFEQKSVADFGSKVFFADWLLFVLIHFQRYLSKLESESFASLMKKMMYLNPKS